MLSLEKARLSLGATLAALGRELSDGQARRLQAWLPAVLHEDLAPQPQSEAESLSRIDFLNDVAARRGTNANIARTEADTVLGVLCEAVSEREINDMADQLPDPVAELLR